MKKILITGKDGQVGWELRDLLSSIGTVYAYGREEMDLQDPNRIRKVMREVKPDIVVNAAAYTAVDRAENDQETAMAINGNAVGILAEESKKNRSLLIHYSTDYVFDGMKSLPYCEDDQPNPLNIYGKSKLEGEKAILAVGGSHLILRTSWVYGLRGKNFLLTMLKLGKEHKSLRIVGDQIGAPTWSRLLAEKTAEILRTSIDRKNEAELKGVYHISSAGSTSWFEFARAIFDLSLQEKPALTKITSIDYPTPATRPQFSVLSIDKIRKEFDLEMPDWKESLECCLKVNLGTIQS